jgi:hypothetical protein
MTTTVSEKRALTLFTMLISDRVANSFEDRQRTQ